MPPDDPQLHYTDRKSHFTNVALDRANDGNHSEWLPETGWAANRDRVVDLYGYYRDLALAQPELFLWAGLGHMAGGAVVGGLDTDPGIVEESVMVAIGRDIFYDLAWLHEAYLDGEDIVDLAELHDTYGEFPQVTPAGTVVFGHAAPAASYAEAWRRITSGDPDLVTQGNRDLLQNEQQSIIQPRYDLLKLMLFTELASSFTNAIHPYHRDFRVEIPTGNILDLEPRWSWITRTAGMYENWVACGSAERQRLLELPFDSIVDRFFGPPGRPDLIVGGP